jgi:hypothetical protein
VREDVSVKVIATKFKLNLFGKVLRHPRKYDITGRETHFQETNCQRIGIVLHMTSRPSNVLVFVTHDIEIGIRRREGIDLTAPGRSKCSNRHASLCNVSSERVRRNRSNHIQGKNVIKSNQNRRNEKDLMLLLLSIVVCLQKPQQ